MPGYRTTLAVFMAPGVCALLNAAHSDQAQLRFGRTEQAQILEVAYPVVDLTAGDLDIVECFSRLPECRSWFDAIQHTPSDPNSLKMNQFLIRFITATIDPASWSNVGGHGSVEYSASEHKLIVRQTASNHEKVAELLSAVHRVLDVEVAVETRLIWLSTMSQMFTKIADIRASSDDPSFLNDRQLKAWLESFQGDVNSSLMQAPRLTIFNGQRASINVGDDISLPRTRQSGTGTAIVNKMVKRGFFCKLTPVVSTDRKTVQMGVELMLSNLLDTDVIRGQHHLRSMRKVVAPDQDVDYTLVEGLETIKLSRNQAIPLNQTYVIPVCKAQIESSRENIKPPLLSRVPYINRLFTNVGYGREEQELFLFVTPRVIIYNSTSPQVLPQNEI